MDTSDESKRTIEEKQERRVDTSLKRRALVKGSAAVLPAVFTLRSGAVFAMGSSMRSVTRCMNMAATRPEPAAISEIEDEWFRRETVCRTLQPLDPTSQQPSGDSVVVYLVPETENWKNADKTQKWIDLPPNPSLPQQQMQLEDGSMVANVTVSDTPGYVLVQVDAEGMEVGLAASPDGIGSPIMTSCFTSIVAP